MDMYGWILQCRMAVVGLCVLMCSYTATHAQDDYGRVEVRRYVDTLEGHLLLGAYANTVLRATTRANASPSQPTRWLERSYDGGRTWAFVADLEDWMIEPTDYAAGIQLLLRKWVTVDSATNKSAFAYKVLWNEDWVAEDSTDQFIQRGFDYRSFIHHPTQPNILFIIFVNWYGGGLTRSNVYFSNDYGHSWLLLDLPSGWKRYAQYARIMFDYSNPEHVFLSIDNQEDHATGIDTIIYFSLDLSTLAYQPHDEVGVMNGFLRKGWGVYPYKQRLWFGDNGGLCEFGTMNCEPLGWIDSIRSFVNGMYDSALYDIYFDVFFEHALHLTTPRGSFHPLLPETFVTHVRVTNKSNSKARFNGLVITTDAGRTWKWALRPDTYHYITKFWIDPINRGIYVDAKTIRTETTTNTYLLYIHKGFVTDVTDPTFTGPRISPIPADDVVSIRGLNSHELSLQVYSTDGTRYVCPIVSTDVQGTTVSVSSLPPGIYLFDLESHGQHTFVTVPVVR